MKLQLLLCLALVLSGGLLGCSTNHSVGTTPIVYPWIGFNGKQLLVRNQLWDVESGEEICQFAVPPQITFSNGVPHGYGYVVAAAISPDGKKVLTATDQSIGPGESGLRPGPIQLWDIASGRKILEFKPDELIEVAQFLPDAKHIVTMSDGRKYPIQIWDAKTGQRLLALPDRPVSDLSPQPVNFSPDGRLIATESSAGIHGHGYETVNIWNPITGRKICTIEDTTNSFFDSAQFSPDGKSILTDESVVLTNIRGVVTNTQRVATIWDAKTGRRIRGFVPVGLPLFTPDGHKIIGGSVRNNCTIMLCDAKSGKEIRQFTIPGAEGWWYADKIMLSDDGKRLVVQYQAGSTQTAAALWNTDTGELIKEFDNGVAISGETVIGFSPQSENFLLFDQKLKPELIDGATGKRLKILEHFRQP
jgi:WD40 repeat protein